MKARLTKLLALVLCAMFVLAGCSSSYSTKNVEAPDTKAFKTNTPNWLADLKAESKDAA